MKLKLKPWFDAEAIQQEMIEKVCDAYMHGETMRSIARAYELSGMKVRKILITGGAFSSEMSTEIDAMYKDGKTVPEIAAILETSTSNVNSYLPYERIIYKMEERSVEADRQQRYRDRKKGLLEPVKQKEMPKMVRKRNQTLVIVVGRKLRKVLPKDLFDDASDPLARYVHAEDPFNPPDPDRFIWCAELTTSGRGENKKSGIALMSANAGFVVIAPFEEPIETVEDLTEHREVLEESLISSIRKGLLKFGFPEGRVHDYTEVINRVEFVKGKSSMPAMRVEEFIREDLHWGKEDEPAEKFNVRMNFDSRKFGHNPLYRRVDESTASMLQLNKEEEKEWMRAFLAPVRSNDAE